MLLLPAGEVLLCDQHTTLMIAAVVMIVEVGRDRHVDPRADDRDLVVPVVTF